MEGSLVMGKLLRMKQASKRAGVHRSTLTRAIKRGRLKAQYTPGGHVRIDEDDLKKLCDEPPSGK